MPNDDDSSSNNNDKSGSDKKGFFGRLRSAIYKKNIDQESAEIIDTIEEAFDNNDNVSRNKREMLFKVASFDRLRVGDVMVPRADIIAVEVDLTLAELSHIFAETQHSRLPIYRENLDNPLGFVHVKDILALLMPNEDGVIVAKMDEKPLGKLKRDLVYVPLSMRLPNLLLQMRAQRCHMALVVDEYGGTDGLVTIEDLVEEIIGEIDDEYDDDEIADSIREIDKNEWEADARVSIDEFHEITGIDFKSDDEELEVDTLGGLAFSLLGRVPLRGEIINDIEGIEIAVVDADPRRINRLIIRKTAAKSDAKDDKAKN